MTTTTQNARPQPAAKKSSTKKRTSTLKVALRTIYWVIVVAVLGVVGFIGFEAFWTYYSNSR
jgi:nitrate reductase NapE component